MPRLSEALAGGGSYVLGSAKVPTFTNPTNVAIVTGVSAARNGVARNHYRDHAGREIQVILYDGPGEDHGLTGARWLEPRLSTRVAWLAAQHVPAKRYLVAVDPAYQAALSMVSARTLAAQGGAMTDAEIEAFRASPDWRLAVALREIDDRGKVPGAIVPGLEAYRAQLREVVASRPAECVG